jgi:hypothetical protein
MNLLRMKSRLRRQEGHDATFGGFESAARGSMPVVGPNGQRIHDPNRIAVPLED